MRMIEKGRGFMKALAMVMLVAGLAMSCDNNDDAKPSISAPTVNAATDITATSFKVTWAQVTGAEKYLLDVSTNSNFSSTVTGFNKKEITATNASVTGLVKKTKYYYRVYAKKGTVLSAASGTKEATTIE